MSLEYNFDEEEPVRSYQAELDSPYFTTNTKLHVLISGAGIAGLMLAILLEHLDISYEIVERCREMKPLGSVMCLNANVLPVFDQLGLTKEILAASKPIREFHFFRGSMKKLGHYSDHTAIERDGYERLVLSRPRLHEILMSKVPPEKIHMGRKVKALNQSEDGVGLRCTDKTEFYGDILVGADGAYSAIRQNLYFQLKQKGLLPECDTRAMSKGFVCLVGVTSELDPSFFQGIEGQYSSGSVMISDNSPYTWSTFTVPNNKICWNVIIQLSEKESEEAQFRTSEWGPETSDKILRQVGDYKTPFGTLGDLIRVTPRELISQVFLEDILYETWAHERVALIGDACHKLLPNAGQGAVNAIQDAVILANCLYEIKPNPTHENLVRALQTYRDERYSHVKTQHSSSQLSAKIQLGHNWGEKMLRYFILNILPKKLKMKQVVKDSAYSPLVAFLPPVPRRGYGTVLPQKEWVQVDKA
ncbi:FAD/NAD(P)-binding domain-containing protein [Linnemannia elongata AG-77]|uniref:FAD/NAD(P)-binding domain-containing protein n=1 Tax=Linnemannia elongata AG-77 TaxID=1314771 RepID=A0A197JK40_9FUNG|nr:FAD/NAD(P)-binding domain-containing protein [Linnemannia elongata AG-77]